MNGSTPTLRDATLQAYRALLRAASYLPDSSARSYIHNHIVFRFKAVAPSKPPELIKPRAFRRPLLLTEARLPTDIRDAGPLAKKRLKYAWKCSRCLERAGRGVEDDLRKVLDLTYGRRGKRRRELVRELLCTPESSLPANEKALEEFIKDPSGPQAQNFTPSEKFRVFLQSQQMQHAGKNTAASIKHLKPKIPKENIWGRPVPVKLQKSLRHKWWALTLGKILPPLPIHEWNRLNDLATGILRAEDLLPRRRRPSPEPLSEDEVNQRVLELFRTPSDVSNIDNFVLDPEKGLTLVLPDPNEEDPSLPPKHHRTQRALRRLYAEIWCTTPTMSQDEVTKQWHVEWGKARGRVYRGDVTKPSVQDLELFEGIECCMKGSRRKKKEQLKREYQEPLNGIDLVRVGEQLPA